MWKERGDAFPWGGPASAMKPLLGKPISMCFCMTSLRPKGAVDDEVSQELVTPA
jgi:hypothetical protein